MHLNQAGHKIKKVRLDGEKKERQKSKCVFARMHVLVFI